LGNSFDKVFRGNAGSAGGAGLDVSNVFSTHLYTGGVSTPLAIVNGIDLDGEGGLVWIKNRTSGVWHQLADTERGANKMLSTNVNNSEFSRSEHVKSFTSTGFTVGNDNDVNYDVQGGSQDDLHVSWTFRKAPKFFDIVTYTGNGSARTISHNLGSVPGMIITKRLDNTSDWGVYHRGYGASGPAGILNGTDAAFSNANYWNNTNPTSAVFSLGNFANVNTNGATYVAYLFAHNNDDGGFGPDGDQDIISCGSFTGNTSADVAVTLGWEPQFLLFKGTGNSSSWYILDSVRGIIYGADDTRLNPDQSYYESQGHQYNIANLTATGFIVEAEASAEIWGANPVIYMAIRAPMITPPEAATEVFNVALRSATSAYSVGFPTDLWIGKETSRANGSFVSNRLIGGTKYLLTPTSGMEQTDSGGIAVFNLQNSFSQGAASQALVNWNWKRAKGYMDVVAYTGNGTSGRTVAHSLGVAPEMMWVKKRVGGTARDWYVYHAGNAGQNSNGAAYGYNLLSTNDNFTDATFAWNNTAPTSSVFSLGNLGTNDNGNTYIAHLFATIAGVSKVGVIAHSGTSTDVDCGFSNGARFFILKRTNTTGDWYVYDSVRGLVAGQANPYLFLNTAAAEVTGTYLMDPLASGFKILDGMADGTYIFYAIA